MESRRDFLLALLSLSPLAPACQQRRVRRRKKKKAPEPEPDEPEIDPTLTTDAATVANIRELKKSGARTLYLLPFARKPHPVFVEPPQGWALAWGQGETFTDWEELPFDAESQVQFLRKFYKKNRPEDGSPIEVVVAYSNDMDLESLGRMTSTLQETSRNIDAQYFRPQLTQSGKIDVEVPEKMARNWSDPRIRRR